MVALDEALSVAINAAETAGELLSKRYHEIHVEGNALNVREKTSPIDLVTDVDAEAQDLIISIIRETYPDHRFIAEEEGADALGDPSSPYTWVIDPLDGTTCFVHGRKNFGTIIALMENDDILLGVMCMPLKSQLFTGWKGGGAFCNGKPLKLRATRDMSDAVLCCNISHRAKKSDDGVLRVSMPFCASVENYGSAVDEIGEVLLGHNDGAFFDGVRLWDIAAGCMMMEELGGRARYEFKEPGNVRSGLLAVTSTAPIFDDLCTFVFENRLT